MGKAGQPVVSYRGYRPDNLAGGRLVVIEINGEVNGPLPHQIKHSPSGFSWGYLGSGPADLARSLLIDALGTASACTVCEGTGEVVYDAMRGNEVPARAAESAGPEGWAGSQVRYSETMGCQYCEHGCAVESKVYQRFKRDVIARLPDDEWRLTRAEILQWAHDNGLAVHP